jgi:hypothetical protein
VLTLIQMEYLEMPDLKLTLRQARRLFDLPLELCENALGTLVSIGFLMQTRDGSFLRRGDAPARLDALTAPPVIVRPPSRRLPETTGRG